MSDALFDEFATTAHRLEGLGTYAIPREDPGLRAFRDSTARPERSVRTSPWVARMAVSTVMHGKLWSRTRVTDDPLTCGQDPVVWPALDNGIAGRFGPEASG